MNLTVQRGQGDAQCTPGELSIEGMHECWTLEPRRDQSAGKPYSIPAATYRLVLSWSAHFSRVVPVLLEVPGFSGVEIHPGNYPGDTHACTLVGDTESVDFVGMSDVAFDALIEKLNGQTEMWITYIDPPPVVPVDTDVTISS